VKIWSVDDRSYVETLFGHNDKISAVDAGTRERAVTAGMVLIRVFSHEF
jgi:ribosomal RNA-processing protein 9